MKFRVETDPGKMFDRLRALNGDHSPLGLRIVSVLMTGEMPFSDAIALEVYGVRITKEDE